jgi:hypothetical protein
VLIRGNIEAGDYAKFVSLLKQNHPFVNEVVLVSSGGRGDEALKIGRIIRRYLLDTSAPYRWKPLGAQSEVDGYGEQVVLSAVVLPAAKADRTTICEGPTCHCASACFLIWTAGASRNGSAIGVHRPTIQSTQFADLPPERASSLYRGLLADIANYLSDMEVPKKYIELMSSTASNDIKWLSSEEAASVPEIPSIAEWVAATCGAITSQDAQEGHELLNQLRPPSGKLPSDEEIAQINARLDANIARGEWIRNCEREKKARYRNAMAPPQVPEAVTPSQGPSNNTAQPPPCPPERLKLAQKYQHIGAEYQLRAMELCPL